MAPAPSAPRVAYLPVADEGMTEAALGGEEEAGRRRARRR